MTNQSIAIIGHKGKTGARVQQRLQALGITTKGLSRSGQIPFDWGNPDGWQSALKDAKAAYVSFQPDLAVPGAQDAIRRLTQEAKLAGVEHLVLLSGRGEEGAQKAEMVLIESGLDWNIVRASWFAQNFSESFMLDGILAGNLALPADSVLEPFVDADDIADVAVAALTKPDLKNQVFEVTGPRAMTFADCVETIAKGIGKPIHYTPITLPDFISTLKSMNVPQDIQWLMNELFGNV